MLDQAGWPALTKSRPNDCTIAQRLHSLEDGTARLHACQLSIADTNYHQALEGNNRIALFATVCVLYWAAAYRFQ